MKKITIQIDKNGKSEIATSGFTGTDCKKATEHLEKRLGNPTSDTETEEAYQQIQQENIKQ